MPNGYTPEPDPPPSIFVDTRPDPNQFENHWVAGNRKYQVIPDISGKPEVSGISAIFRVFPDMTGLSGITPRQSWVVVGGSFRKNPQ